ncbi:MAG: adenylosuccinate lyase [Candidatus Omnitrophica bacterium]|nr:adenylosuccinate lyase [Candidatus Omnitrophota bacterium]
MIERYTLPRMASIWTEENKWKIMLKVEILACEALSKLKIIPKQDLFQIKKKAKFDIDRINQIEKKTNHDVVAFIANLSENIGEAAKYIHYGLTSSDVLDTSLSVMMCQALDILIDDTKKLMQAFKRKARRFKNAIMIGRSHGMHAEPTSFGIKMALFYDETKRDLERLKQARDVIAYGKISGSVGTYANINPFVEEYVCKKLGLKPAKVSSQILQRDRHAQYLNAIAICGASLEKFATEFRSLQRTEIGEVQEFFSSAQKGSSSMPHKKNPIMCERVCGLARILRANAIAGIENMPLWHERDISHSSVERVIVPDSTILLDYMLNKMIGIADRLIVNVDRMKENLEKTNGIIFSQRVMLELINRGFTRQEAYDIVQKAALTVQAESLPFLDAIAEDKRVRGSMSRTEVEACGDLGYHLKHADYIFRKVGI